MAASEATGELDSYLQCIQRETWSSAGIIQLLTAAGLEQLDASWARFDRSTKVRCLLSFMHAKSTFVEKHAKALQSVIERALSDPDHWVMGLARLLDGFPDTGKVPCEQVDNELINFRLTEALERTGAKKVMANLAQIALPWRTAEAVALSGEAGDSERKGLKRNADCVFVGSAEETFKWIREGDEAEFDDLMKAMERRESPGNTSRPRKERDNSPEAAVALNQLDSSRMQTASHSGASLAAVPGRGFEPTHKDYIGQAVRRPEPDTTTRLPSWAWQRRTETKPAENKTRRDAGAPSVSRKPSQQARPSSPKKNPKVARQSRGERATAPVGVASPLLEEVPVASERPPASPARTAPPSVPQELGGMPLPRSAPASHGPKL